MFSTKELLIKRTGKNKVGRFEFLQLLVKEFNTTKSSEAKQQVLANLANFAYDPINYEYIRELFIIDLFLDELESNDETLVEFSLGGLCNLCLDPLNKEYIIKKKGISVVSKSLFSSNEEIVLNAITILMFLTTPQTKPEITSPEIVECMVTYLRSPNVRIRNLATVFLEDYCPKYQVNQIKKIVDSKLGPLTNDVETLKKVKDLQFESQWTKCYCSYSPNKLITIERTISLEDINTFSILTNDFNSIHNTVTNSKPIVHGAFLNGLVSGVIGTKLPGDGTIVISQNLKFPKPCYAGDTVLITVNLTDFRKIVTCSFNVVNKFDGTIVMEGVAKLLIRKNVL